MLSQAFTDFRHSLRLMGRRPGFTALAVLTLALGIGANTAIFSVIYGVLLAPLPYEEADRLVRVWNKYPLMDLPKASVSIPDYFDRREGVDAFEEAALYSFRSVNLSENGPPERLVGVEATASLFPLLRESPLHGTTWSEEAEQPGQDDVVVLSHGLWQRRFGGDPDLVGQDIRLSGRPFRVLAVMPESFEFPSPRVDVWKPFPFTPEQKSDDSRGNEYSHMIARLAPGASLEQAQQQIDAIHEANKERFPQAKEFWESSGFGGMVVDYREELYGDLRPTLFLLQAVVAFVLLIACANVANLMLSRLQARQKELALRASLGASRLRMASQLLTEGLALSLVGGLLGIWLGWLGVRLLTHLELAGGVEIGLDPNVLFFTLGVSLLTGILASLLPILAAGRTQPQEVLKEGGGHGTSGGRKAAFPRHALVVAEMACAVILLVGAGLMVRTLAALLDEDTGFDPGGVLTAQVALPATAYPESEDRIRFFEETLERARHLPGVSHAGMVSNAPFSGGSASGSYTIDGYTPAAGESQPHALQRVVDEDYFAALGIELLAGRGLDRRDTEDTQRVVVVDHRLVEKYFPEGEAVGGRIQRGGNTYEIVGVVEPVKISDLERPITKETLYYSFRQVPRPDMTLVLKTSIPPTEVVEPLRQAVLETDSEQPIYNVVTMEERLADSVRTRRVSMVLLVAFGGLAALLAAIGIYGVLAFSVSRRTRELGTRMALGAQTHEILHLVLRRGLRLTLIGLAVGLVAALALGRFLAGMVYGVSLDDPSTFLGVALLLITVSLVACLQPALRASRVAPMEALREE